MQGKVKIFLVIYFPYVKKNYFRKYCPLLGEIHLRKRMLLSIYLLKPTLVENINKEMYEQWNKSLINKVFDKELVAYAFCDFKLMKTKELSLKLSRIGWKGYIRFFWFYDKSGIIFAWSNQGKDIDKKESLWENKIRNVDIWQRGISKRYLREKIGIYLKWACQQNQTEKAWKRDNLVPFLSEDWNRALNHK